jgi:hypothetical protein
MLGQVYGSFGGSRVAGGLVRDLREPCRGLDRRVIYS